MRQFLVNVNGTKYEVSVEELAGGVQAPAVAPAPKAAPAPAAAAPAPAPAPAPAAAPAASGSGNAIVAPMPGTVLSVAVKQGEAVKRGQLILVLEAMKMENEIFSDYEGTVTELCVQTGNTVDTGAVFCRIG